MAWRLVYFETEAAAFAAGLPVGAIWPDGRGHYFVSFPGPVVPHKDWVWHSQKWTVKGEAPGITVEPSVKFVEPGGYHGFIREGIITDDCEGHQFPHHPATA